MTCLPTTKTFTFADISNNSFVSFTIWDFPGQMDIFDREFDFSNVFKGCGALVFVIDSQVRFRSHFNCVFTHFLPLYK